VDVVVLASFVVQEPAGGDEGKSWSEGTGRSLNLDGLKRFTVLGTDYTHTHTQQHTARSRRWREGGRESEEGFPDLASTFASTMWSAQNANYATGQP